MVDRIGGQEEEGGNMIETFHYFITMIGAGFLLSMIWNIIAIVL